MMLHNKHTMYTHTYTYTYTHAHTHTTHTYTNTYIHKYIHTCRHTHTHAHTHKYAHTYTHTCTHTKPHTHIHAHAETHTETHIHAHTETHTETHIHVQTPSLYLMVCKHFQVMVHHSFTSLLSLAAVIKNLQNCALQSMQLHRVHATNPIPCVIQCLNCCLPANSKTCFVITCHAHPPRGRTRGRGSCDCHRR